MILGIDAFNLRSGGGLTHLVEILKAARLPMHGFERVIVWGGADTLAKIPHQDWLTKVHENLLDRGLFSRVYWHRFKLRNLAIRSQCDVLFVPGGSDATGFHPIVTMSRNILPFDFNEIKRYGFSIRALKFILLRIAQSRSFLRADGVIFLNNYAREKVLGVTGKLSGKEAIIPHGISKRFMLGLTKVHRISSDFNKIVPCKILYVSSIEAYKHQWIVAEAVSQLKLEGYAIVLDMVGPAGGGMSKLIHSLKRLDPKGEFLRYLGPVNYDRLSDIYQEADIGIFASTCENMPNTLLEYMAAGVPVACSNRGPMPEILGDSGKYFDPEDVNSIKFVLIDLMNSLDLRIALSATAFESVQRYSWEKCADETFKFLEDIAMLYRAKKSAHSFF
jgi:glycosyltransferase involved in cell wall biosynthesis